MKLIDFGFSCCKPETAAFGEQSASKALKTPCFTLNYAAPEVLNTAQHDVAGYNEMCDLWSLGVILVRVCSFDVFQLSSFSPPLLSHPSLSPLALILAWKSHHRVMCVLTSLKFICCTGACSHSRTCRSYTGTCSHTHSYSPLFPFIYNNNMICLGIIWSLGGHTSTCSLTPPPHCLLSITYTFFDSIIV